MCLFFVYDSTTEDPEMKQLVGLHGPLAVNVDATMWHDYLSEFALFKCIHRKTKTGVLVLHMLISFLLTFSCNEFFPNQCLLKLHFKINKYNEMITVSTS